MDIKRAREIIGKNLDLMEKKNKDYSGSSGDNITETGMLGMATRIIDKASRFKNLVNKEDVNFESVEDTLDDLMNYAIIARMLKEGTWQSKPKLVYLAGPIDDVDEDGANHWRRYVSNMLGRHGINTFNPYLAYNVANLDTIKRQVSEIDRAAIAQCDMLFANLSGNGRAFGTIREIEYARSLNIPVIVVAKNLVSAFAHDVECFNEIPEAVARVTGQTE